MAPVAPDQVAAAVAAAEDCPGECIFLEEILDAPAADASAATPSGSRLEGRGNSRALSADLADTETGVDEAADQLPAGHRRRAELDGPITVVRGDVVVVALERAAGDAEALGEGVGSS